MYGQALPSIIVPIIATGSVGPYLTSDGNGNLDWTTTFYSPVGGTEVEVGPYLTSDFLGNLDWQSKTIPATDSTTLIGPYLTSNGSGSLTWEEATVVIITP